MLQYISTERLAVNNRDLLAGLLVSQVLQVVNR